MIAQKIKNSLFVIAIIFMIPHYTFYIISSKRNIINSDIKSWLKILELNYSLKIGLFYLLFFKREFRNLFYFRIGKPRILLNLILPKVNTLYLPSKHIGGGLYIEHGFSTIVAAEFIGDNCWINQQVTVGYKNKIEGPYIYDNVKIHAGAIVIGNVKIGKDSIIGAGSVVTKDIPDNAVVIGNPARIIRLNGKRVNIDL